MFKLKAGNVIEKLNKMDRKQAYTYGAIGVGVLVALILLASFLGNAEESSFDDFSTRGYDLANSPFVTDEAEEFLLASAYPDMKNNDAYTLYGPAEKAQRQAEDSLAQEEEESSDDFSSSASDSASYNTSSGYTYRGGRGGSGSRNPTQVGQLGGASMSHASGSGTNSSWGSPRLDTTPYQRNEMGKDPINSQAKGADARRALSQFASSSQAGARLKEGKAVNMKRALQGGDIIGATMNPDGTVDLSKVDAMNLDTNAPEPGSADLDNLGDNLSKAADDAKDKDDNENKGDELSFFENILQMGAQKLFESLANAAGKFAEKQVNSWSNSLSETRDLNRQAKNMWNEDPLSNSSRQVLKNMYPDANWDGCKTMSACSAGDGWKGPTSKSDFKRSWRTSHRNSGGNN